VTWPSTSEQLDHLRLAAKIAGIKVDSIVLPEERDLVVRGLNLHYLDWGTCGRPPILFLHGGGLTAHTWDLVCLQLRRNYRCVALDQRGHGESAWPPDGDYGTETYVADIEALVERLQLHQPVLVGQSLGGVNALTYAARHSDEMTALVVVDAGPQVRRGGAQRISDFISATAHLHSLEEFVERARHSIPGEIHGCCDEACCTISAAFPMGGSRESLTRDCSPLSGQTSLSA
jgi:esterase